MSRLIEKNLTLGFSDPLSNFTILIYVLFSTRSLIEEDSKDRFDDADKDVDGFITWAEYKKYKEVDLEDPEMAEEWKLMEEDR